MNWLLLLILCGRVFVLDNMCKHFKNSFSCIYIIYILYIIYNSNLFKLCKQGGQQTSKNQFDENNKYYFQNCCRHLYKCTLSVSDDRILSMSIYHQFSLKTKKVDSMVYRYE